MKKLTLLFVLFFVFLCEFMAQEIGKVEFRQEGNFQFPVAVLRDNVQTKKGLMFSERILNDDVRRLYALGVFADVVTMVETLPDGKKAVTFRVSAKPVVTAVIFEGNRKYTNEKLREFVKIFPGSPLNEKLLSETASALRNFYDEEGLKDAKIFPQQLVDGTGVKIVFRITENLRRRVNSVQFKGIKVYKPEELRDALETQYTFLSANWLSWLPVMKGVGLVDTKAVERDKMRLREMYWRKGHLDFKLKGIQYKEADNNPELIDIIFDIEEGEPYFVGDIRIAGNTRFPEDELRQMIVLQKDNVYSSIKDDAFMKALEEKYLPLGYADFAVRVKKVPNFETHTVDLEYTLHEGTPFTIGEVYISGNKWTKDHVIRRELLFYPDDPVDKNVLEITKNRLLGMGYFEQVSEENKGVDIVTANSPNDPGKKDVFVNVKERRFIDGKVGVGWSDSDSFAGMLELTHSNVDILDPKRWFTGGGQRVRLMGLAGLEHMGFEADFTEPWLFGIPLRLDISGYWRTVTYDDWDERRIGFSITLTKRIFDDFTTLSGGYLFEHVKVEDMSHGMSEKFTKWKGGDFVGRVFMTLERDTRNSITNPTDGYYVSAFASVTTEGLGASNNYYKWELKGINYFSFFNKWFVLSTGFKVGSTGTFHSDEEVPLYDRYFLGGGDSVRGFPYRSIGPQDRNDDNYGGQFMYLLTAELSHPIWNDTIRGGFFVEVGSATSGTIGPIDKPNVGLGYGLRIKLPNVNMPIRLDLAYPVYSSVDDLKKRLRFHFNMGFSFL